MSDTFGPPAGSILVLSVLRIGAPLDFPSVRIDRPGMSWLAMLEAGSAAILAMVKDGASRNEQFVIQLVGVPPEHREPCHMAQLLRAKGGLTRDELADGLCERFTSMVDELALGTPLEDAH